MATPDVAKLLDPHGRTFCDELGIRIARNTPQPLFQWLTACILYANPIQRDLAATAAKAVFKSGLRSAKAMAASSWEERAEVLGWNKFGQYSERTATILKDAADLVLERYGGDLRRLRAAADGDVDEVRRLLKEVKGVGDVAATIYLREVQTAWPEFHPYADDLALRASERHGLGATPQELAEHVCQEDFARLVAALTREELSQ
ncbi:hypothetical protein [Acuticoccus sp.]|uniref:hypothetical protein n=1 Tax=Acuticoccus sp. TaxID=1904378 RepID=UPI003B525DE4